MKQQLYFTFNKAKRLISINTKSLSDKKLLEYIVTLRDYERYMKNSHVLEYKQILINGGYFVSACTHASTGITPRDMWMIANISNALDEAIIEKKKRMNVGEYRK